MKLSALAILSYLVVWNRAYSSSPEDGHGVSRERDVNILFAYLRPSGGVVSRVNPAQSYIMLTSAWGAIRIFVEIL